MRKKRSGFAERFLRVWDFRSAFAERFLDFSLRICGAFFAFRSAFAERFLPENVAKAQLKGEIPGGSNTLILNTFTRANTHSGLPKANRKAWRSSIAAWRNERHQPKTASRP